LNVEPKLILTEEPFPSLEKILMLLRCKFINVILISLS